MRVFQKNFVENALVSSIVHTIGFCALFFVPKTLEVHPARSSIAIAFFTILTLSKLWMVFFSKGRKVENIITFILLIISGAFWSTLLLVELLAQPTLNPSVATLIIFCAMITSAASFALYKKPGLIITYLIVLPGFSTIYIFLFLTEMKIIFGFFTFAGTIFMLVYVRTHYKNWKNFLAEKARSENLTKNLENQAKELRQIKVAIDNTSDAIGIATHDGTHFYQNKAFTKMFGYSVKEVKSIRPAALYNNAEDAKKIFDTIMAGNEYSVEIEMISKNGNKFPVDIRANAIKDRNGKIINLISVHTNITERKQAEEKQYEAQELAEEMNDQLEQALEQANFMAVEADMANVAKSEFLANMSHEIRTPMNGVIGMTTLLLDTPLNEEQRDFTNTIQNSSEALLNIINDILDYSKIEAGKYELENINFDLKLTIDKLCDLSAIKAHEKGLEFICMVDHKVPSLLIGDPGRLRQILINLSGNAIKFTQKGEIIIRTSLENEDAAKATLRFSVSDTGVGIPKNRIDAIFQSFSQADSSTTRKYGGTGLGLTISKQLAEMMGGEMHVESEEGKGSEFWFTAIFKKQDNSPRKKIIVPQDISTKHILIVDDNDTNRYLLREQLKLWGCRYDEASSGFQALEKLKQASNNNDRFEIVILDMQMPEMDGETLGEKINQDPDLKNTKLVLMTSMGGRGDAKRLEKIEFAAYLTKPVKQSQLFDCLSLVSGIKKQTDTQLTETIITQHSLADKQKSKFRILLAEDNPINQKVATAILMKLGYKADIVANGSEVLQALLKNRYSIILMDCQMPEMDGYSATKKIRKLNSEIKNIPIIAMTANAMASDRNKCIDAGMDDYLTKPVKPQLLSDMLEKWLLK